MHIQYLQYHLGDYEVYTAILLHIMHRYEYVISLIVYYIATTAQGGGGSDRCV
jgi:hypothetical protein